MYHIFGKRYHFYLHWRIFWARKLWFSVISTREVNNYTLPRLFLWLLDSCQQKNINIPDCLKYFFNKRVFHDDCLDSELSDYQVSKRYCKFCLHASIWDLLSAVLAFHILFLPFFCWGVICLFVFIRTQKYSEVLPFLNYHLLLSLYMAFIYTVSSLLWNRTPHHLW